MLEITVSDTELFDEESETFFYIPGGVYIFEHSLKAIMKWESVYHKPFLSSTLTDEEWIYYYKCMAIGPAPEEAHLTEEVCRMLEQYISNPHTATKIAESQSQSKTKSGGKITAESIYSMMSLTAVPYTCDEWHLNNLMALLRINTINSGGKTKMSRNDIYKQNNDLNRQRRELLKSRG